MINTSSEYQNKISGDRKFKLYADITLLDSTVLNLDDTDIMQGDMEFEDAVSGDGAFQIGAAIINKNTISLNNFKGKFDQYDFTGATVISYVGLQLSASVEKLKKGFFTVDESNAIGNTISIESLDNMQKFEKPFKDVTLVFPTTALLALTAICTYCGVVLSTDAFTNSDFTIQSRPVDDALTCLDMVSYIAQIAGCYARCNVDGELEIKWYDLTAFENEPLIDGGYYDNSFPYSTGDSADGGNFTDYTSGATIDGGTFTYNGKFNHLYNFGGSPTIAVDDVVITGIQVSDNTENPNTVLFGTSGYILSIEKNPLIQNLTDVQTIANTVGVKIVGMRFRPFSASVLSNPEIEAGDAVYLSVRTKSGYNTYQSYVTSLSYKVNSRETIKCEAETPSKNSSKSYSALTKAIVESRKNTEAQLTAYDLIVQQMTKVVANGLGVFTTRITDETGAIIEYLHDKPIMSESVVRWFTTADGTIEQNQVDGQWITVSGTDKHGNALYNVLYAKKVSADIIRTGKILSDDGSVLIDMAYGVANSDNISFVDNIANGFPLRMPFNIDSAVSKITKVLLKYTIDKYRTYSTTASSGGGSTQTSETANVNASIDSQTITFSGSTWGGGSVNQSTGVSNGSIGNHAHNMSISEHTHQYEMSSYHSHNVVVGGHSHSVSIPSHEHGLNYGIMETPITDYSFDVYVDNVLKHQVTNDIANAQGIIDLTAYITTNEWHTVEIRSTTLKRISAQVNIKSYIRD